MAHKATLANGSEALSSAQRWIRRGQYKPQKKHRPARVSGTVKPSFSPATQQLAKICATKFTVLRRRILVVQPRQGNIYSSNAKGGCH